MPDHIKSASDYLSELFTPSDHIAITLVHKPTSTVVQRTGLAHDFASDKYQRWLRYQNAKHFEVYATMNTVKPFSHGRTKADILDIRHVYLDLDEHGEAALSSLLKRTDIPHPNYIVQTSIGKYQILWKVHPFPMHDAERLLRAFARETGADIAATDAARVLRIPGFLNHKYNPPHFVTALRFHPHVFSRSDFPTYPLPSAAIEPSSVPTLSPRYGIDDSPSGRDWRTALSRLRRGDDPQAVTNDIIAARSDKSHPRYYAERTVLRALSLIERTPTLPRA